MNALPSLAARAAACLLAVLVVALGSTGCNALPGTPLGDAYGAMPPVVYDEPMTLCDHVCFWTKPLPRALPVRSVQHGPLPTGNLKAVVEVRNNTARQLRIEYRFRYFDDAGSQIEDTDWTPKLIEARVDDQLASNSVSTRAKRWQLHIRRAR